MTDTAEDLEREWAFYACQIDPVVNEILTLDAWEAYERTAEMTALLTDTSPGGSFELPHTGELYVAWGRLTDLYDTGTTPIDEAHAVLRASAKKWLDRPTAPTGEFIERWTSEANEAADALFQRDGNWWHQPG